MSSGSSHVHKLSKYSTTMQIQKNHYIIKYKYN